MPRQVMRYELLLSCPSDVKEELNIIRETVEEFNRLFGEVNDMLIVTKHWSTDSYPESGDHPQNLLNKQFVLDCDAAVAVFWTRFGTPTKEYSSGTEEEIVKLLQSGKQVFLYFSDCAVSPSLINQEQYQNVQNFRDKYKDQGIYHTFNSLDEFKKRFLSHLTLHFLRLQTEMDTSTKNVKSDIQIKGVREGQLTEEPIVIQKSFMKSHFLANKKNSVYTIIKQIKDIVIAPNKIVEEKPIVNTVTDVDNNALSKLGGFAIAYQKQLTTVGSIFQTSDVVIDDALKKGIRKFLVENIIDYIDEEFFCLGQLLKRKDPLGGGILRTGSSYQLVGSDNEKEKYELLKNLSSEVTSYYQYVDYFTELDSKFNLELAVTNLGTTFDEDIDIKIYIKKGLICSRARLPYPGDYIIEDINKSCNFIFKSKQTVSISEYDGYPARLPNIDLSYLTKGDKLSYYRTEYKNSIDTIFCYNSFQDDENDILCYNLDYIKQHQSIYLPSIIVFDVIPEKINYKITSKHSPEIICGELIILNNIETF